MFPGSADQPPLITNDESAWSNSKHAATVPSLPTVHFTLDDRDLLKLATGGMSGVQAITERRVKVKGDLMLAKSMQRVFREAGGVERVLKYMRENAVPIKGTKGNAVPARQDGRTSSKAKPRVKAKSKL